MLRLSRPRAADSTHSYLVPTGGDRPRLTRRAGDWIAAPPLAPRPARPEWLLAEVHRLAERPIGRNPLTGLPDGETSLVAGQLIMDWLNSTGEQGLYAVLDIPAMRDVGWAFDADAVADVWRQAAERLSWAAPVASFVGHPQAGLALQAWGIADEQARDRLLASVQEAFDRPFDVAGRQMYLHPNIGALAYPQDSGRLHDQATVLRLAATALASIDDGSRGRVARWSSEDRARLLRRVLIDQLLLDPAARDRMHLVFQPRFCTVTGACLGAEALTRWAAPELGEIGPSEFIPLAEANGTILDVTERTLEGVTAWLGAHLDALPAGFRAGVNISSTLMRSVGVGLVDVVASALERNACPGSTLELELTEAAVMDVGVETVRAVVDGWRALGVQVALDDFGAGYSAIVLLGEIPLDLLKLDRSIACAYERDPVDRRLFQAIAATARAFALPVVVEGVERPETVAALREMGLEMAQGNALSTPVDGDRLARRLRRPLAVGVRP